MFEPKILTEVNLPKVVETNLAELDGVIAEKVANANALVVTNNKADVVAADKDAAELNKMSERIKRFRIDFVDWWKKPLADVEARCKKYEKSLSDTAKDLRAKTEEVKEIWRNAEREEYRQMWDAHIAENIDSELSDSPYFVEFFDTWTNPKTVGSWCNASMSGAKVDAAMLEEIKRIKTAIETAKAMWKDDDLIAALRELRVRFDLTDAVNAVNRYKAVKEESARKAAEQEREVRIQNQIKAERKMATEPVDLLTYRLAVTGSRDALFRLKEFCLNNGIQVKNLDK